MTKQQLENIRRGLGPFALERRFVVRRGKMPVDPNTGYGAKANDPSTWGTLDQAIGAMCANQDSGIDGIGVELGGGLCGIDLDHCIDERRAFTPQALEVITAMDSYTEISLSGTGIHILFSGSLPQGTRRKNGIEMYSEGRYFTVTGNLYELKHS